jgi:hypothetical protein
MQRELVERLALAVRNGCIDFGFGVAGGQTLKKGADLNVTNVMTNSPGGVQQGGVGHLSQKVVQEVHSNLIRELETMLSASDFQALDEEEQSELRDLADTVREEIVKERPDEAKVQRRGARWSKS